MAATRRRSNLGFDPPAKPSSHLGMPQTLYPPEGYCLVESDLHRATTCLQVASFPFLAQLKLRTAINLSPDPLHEKVVEFFESEGIALLAPLSLEAIDGPYDLWEEAAKESLELILDAGNQPMILLDSPTECEAACLIGCLRRLQHWSVCAIHDEYHMMTMKSGNYDTNQRFVERFDLQLVTLKDNLPSWFEEHLSMMQDEREAEEALHREDPQGSREEGWSRGALDFGVDGAASAERAAEGAVAGNDPDRPGAPEAPGGRAGESKGGVPLEGHRKAAETGDEGKSDKSAGAPAVKRDGGVPDYRLNRFVYLCPLVSAECKFTPKLWLQDEDDG